MSNKTDRQDSIDRAKAILADKSVVILDTETTDLYGEIIEIAIIDIEGNTLLNKRIKPQGTSIHPKALETHGISLKMLENEPQFKDVYADIQVVLKDKHVVIYNADFDLRILASDCKLAGLPMFSYASSSCAMLIYSQYIGDWNDYHGNYRWQRLPSGDHSALGDCLATLKVLREMASE